MWPFDFFKKKREAEERARQLAEAEKFRREQDARDAKERAARLEREREEKRILEQESIKPFTFESNCHQRYEHNTPKMGLQECIRTVTVEKNTNGCKGYKLSPGIGYIVKVYNNDLGKPNMSDKPMKVVKRTKDYVELRGYPIEAMGPFGWQEVDYRDYGFFVYYMNGVVDKCVLHMYDRNIRIEYLHKSLVDVEDRYTKMVKEATFNPFNITCDPKLQNNTNVPDLRVVFSRELDNLGSKVANVQGYNLKDLVAGYAFNLVESYYNNAGYVPKNSLDQILEQVYDALKTTRLKSVFSTLDDLKYHCYYGYLHQ